MEIRVILIFVLIITVLIKVGQAQKNIEPTGKVTCQNPFYS